MTVSTTTTVHTYVGDGEQGEWPIFFPFFTPQDVKAIRTDAAGNDTELMYGSEYAVTAFESGGSCTCPLGAGERLTLYLDLDHLQQTDLSNTGILAPEIIERGLDRLTLIAQQHREAISRCVQIGRTSGLTPNQLLESIDRSAVACAEEAQQAQDAAVDAQHAATEAEEARDTAVNAAASVVLPEPRLSEAGRGLVVAENGGWQLGGTAASRNVGTGDNDLPTVASLTQLVDLTRVWDAIALTTMWGALGTFRSGLNMAYEPFVDMSGINTDETTARFSGSFFAHAGGTTGLNETAFVNYMPLKNKAGISFGPGAWYAGAFLCMDDSVFEAIELSTTNSSGTILYAQRVEIIKAPEGSGPDVAEAVVLARVDVPRTTEGITDGWFTVPIAATIPAGTHIYVKVTNIGTAINGAASGSLGGYGTHCLWTSDSGADATRRPAMRFHFGVGGEDQTVVQSQPIPLGGQPEKVRMLALVEDRGSLSIGESYQRHRTGTYSCNFTSEDPAIPFESLCNGSRFTPDGDDLTRYRSVTAGQHLTYDAGEVLEDYFVDLRIRVGLARLEYSLDGSTWTTLLASYGAEAGTFAENGATHIHGQFRYVRAVNTVSSYLQVTELSVVQVVPAEGEGTSLEMGAQFQLEVSRDGGTTFAMASAPASLAPYDQTVDIYETTAEFVGVPEGEQVVYRLTFAESANINIHALWIQGA